MREFSVPASVRVDDRETLSDAVFTLAAQRPSAVALRRRGADGAWTDVTYSTFVTEVVDVARGLVAFDVDDLPDLLGKSSADLPAEFRHEVVHRDDIVLLA